ncbi:MAG: exodeoxyribonuclease V subunit gamma, partial [Casimicrobiaceae bacterium]
MLRIVLSNRYEVLEHALLARLDLAPSSPFDAQQVIVPSAAIRRKVELAIADRTGICAHVEFPFLAQWLWQEIGRVVPVAQTSPFAPEILAWRVYAILGDAAFVSAHAPLARYLAEADERMRFDLAGRLAALIEHYITYRPEWLAAWSEGRALGLCRDGAPADDERWQAALWRRIAKEVNAGRRHPAHQFLDTLGAGAPPAAAPSRRVQLFCLPAMPPLYLHIVRGLARAFDVDLYALDPSQEYWFDVVDARRLAWLTTRGRDAHHETGNRLLSAWGKPTQDFLASLFDDQGEAALDASVFVQADGDSLLARLQNSILTLTDPAPASLAVDARDRSLEVHVCHSRTREVEVLHDRLLALFAGDPSLSPADVLVVTPDLAADAPLIDAVFGNAQRPRHVPYAITGRPRSEENPVASALLAVLALASSRFPASAAFELLERRVVARRFGLDATDLPTLHRWLRQSGIRWGLDTRDRRAADVPDDPRHSFDDGLDRLFAGYAWPAGATAAFDECLPAGDAEGTEAVALGALAQFVAALVQARDAAARAMPPAAWFDTLHALAAAFIAPAADDIESHAEVDVALATLRDNLEQGGVAEPLHLPVVRAALAAVVDAPARGGVPTGMVTFASMASLRGLPYRVVCAFGLDDGAFPALPPRIEFDLMRLAPRRGDRQRRLDDRNVLLDLLLAARDVFHVSYVGRSVRDNAPLPPAAALAELIDYVLPLLACAPGAPRDPLRVAHPLQPFSLDAFTGADARIRSFDEDYASALRARLATPAEPLEHAAGDDETDEFDDDVDVAAAARPPDAQSPFFNGALPAPGPEWHTIPFDRFLRFFDNPSRALLRDRLGVALPDQPLELEDDEPFVPDPRTRGALAERLLLRLRAGEPVGELRRIARAGAEFPSGPYGALLLDRELALLASFAQALA